MIKKSWVERLGVVSGTLSAIALSPMAGKAAVATFTGSPVSNTIGSNTTSFWDIDGDSQSEFRLHFAFAGSMFLGSSNNARGIASFGFADNVKLLVASNMVGPTNGFYGNGNYAFRNIMAPGGAIGYDFNQAGQYFQQGDNYFGFRFLQGGNTHHGFAVLNFDSPNKTVTISSWAYETTPNTTIHVDAFGPTPAPGPLGLAGLAAGAGWARTLRARVKASK